MARIHYGSQDTTGAVYRSKSKRCAGTQRWVKILGTYDCSTKPKGRLPPSAQVPEVPRSCSRVKRYVLLVLAHVSTQCILTVTRELSCPRPTNVMT